MDPTTGEQDVVIDCPKCGQQRRLAVSQSDRHTCPRCSTILVTRPPASEPSHDGHSPEIQPEPEHEPGPRSATLILGPDEVEPGSRDTALKPPLDADLAAIQKALVRPAPPPQEMPPGVEEALADPSRRLGHYALLDELGRGGMGVVYRAYDTVLRRHVAIKWMILDPTQAGDERVRRFRREASATARLRHPGIVTVFETGEQQGKPYIVMELIEGESLEALLAREPMPARQVVQVVRAVAQALDHAHQCGVVHRDVKPENVIVDHSGAPHLMDFGLARDATLAENMTVTGHVVGTPAYMAPEQARGKRDLGPQTDVYGLGAILYRALTGRPPFTAENVMLCLRKVLSEDPEPLRKVNPKVHPDLEAIALRCLAKEPGKRYAFASEVAEDLRRYLDGEPISAARPDRHAARARPARRRSLWVTVAAATVVVVLGGTLAAVPLGVYTFRAIEAKKERESLLRRSRAEANQKWERFRKEAGRPAPADEDEEQKRLRLEPLVGLALEAADATDRVVTLVPDDLSSRRRAIDAALMLGDLAIDCEQWSLATQAYTRARDLGGNDPRSRSAFLRVEKTQERVREGRRKAVEAVIAEVSSGSRSRGARDDALFTLVGYGLKEPQTVVLVAAALDEVSQELRGATREAYLEGAREGPEDGAGRTEPELERAVDRWLLLAPGETPDATTRASLERAARRLEERSDRHGKKMSFHEIVVSLQERLVGPDRLELASICCEALGRIGIRKGATPTLGRFLAAVEDEHRAVPAGVALCLLGGDEALKVLEIGRDRFGTNGPFWEEISRVLERRAAARPATETPRAYLDRALLRRERGDFHGAIADTCQALELDPSCAEALHDRAIVRERSGDREGAILDLERLLELLPPDTPEAAGTHALLSEFRAQK